MATKTSFVCDCCHRESDADIGWAHINVKGLSSLIKIVPDENRDLCPICWDPLNNLMHRLAAEAKEG